MRVVVVGTGYVGLVVGACLAETGNDVTCVDIDAAKIAGLQAGVIPIYEPGLGEIAERNRAEGRLHYTSDTAAAAADADVVFLAVGTPAQEDGSADPAHVMHAAETVARSVRREVVVITKSTVPVGTTHRVAAVFRELAAVPAHVCSNPEFLKEGAALADFLRPDRVVIGVETDFARDVLTRLYAPFVRTGRPLLFMDIASAELTKYAANAMLASRISFMNELTHLCDAVGADIDHIRRGIGADERIGSSFLFPGPGYGGSCFPKDVRALISMGRANGVALGLIEATHAANERQKQALYTLLHDGLGGAVAGKHVALWGLTFKPQTDDLRESPALSFLEATLGAGATVTAHDPVGMARARELFASRAAFPACADALADGRLTFAASSLAALADADALVVATDWNVYRTPDFDAVRSALRGTLIVDGRNLYDPTHLASLGLRYASLGRPQIAPVNEACAS